MSGMPEVTTKFPAIWSNCRQAALQRLQIAWKYISQVQHNPSEAQKVAKRCSCKLYLFQPVNEDWSHVFIMFILVYCFVYSCLYYIIVVLPDEEKSETLSSNKQRLNASCFLSLIPHIVKTVKLAVWTDSLNFLHDFTLFVADIHQIMLISLFLTPFDHFHFHPFSVLISRH